jgi:hypothetical protein
MSTSANAYKIPAFQSTGASGNPRASALETMNAAAAKQSALNNVAHGGRRRRYGGQTTVVLPQAPTPIYNDVNKGTSFGADAQMKAAMVGTMNQTAQAQYDNQVKLVPPQTKGGRKTKGGMKTKRRGGVKWGCLSGGKRRSQKSKKSKKTRKTRRR